ncbi:hypothetical protein H6501_05295 [Candidatus Woesearchaeota archaeon]|nr:hypothetical protein [Nanoarchaeota archaeon]MCB9370989.1 hypothetical protein [Candidatus Woesearchaeota archaeon]USN44090.1 MAG: hypothetical protein H6500_06910 [Candidatus Woesearchaeota archaeon]
MVNEDLLSKFEISKEKYEEMKNKGKVLDVYRALSGRLMHRFVSNAKKANPCLVLVEKYRLSTFSGSYGVGRTIKTFSLLPGESTTISVSSYKRSSQTSIEASSILDSYTDESAEEFEQSVSDEQSNTSSQEKECNYHAEASAKAGWGWGSATVSGGVSGGVSSAREEFAKNVSTATSKNSAKASSKRDVSINTSFESKREEGEEKSTVREIKNINVGRTLNFVFRQMIQEYITVLHLVDVRVAFFNGYRGSKVEVPLYELDKILETFIKEEKRTEVKTQILTELSSLRDYQGRTHEFIELVPESSPELYRIKPDFTSFYEDENNNSFEVPGIIVNANKNVLRTEGVMVESLLGESNALDDYSISLQDEKIRKQELENQSLELENQLKIEKIKILQNKDETASKIYRNLFFEEKEKKEE